MLTLGYLNLALNNLTQIFRVQGSTASPKPFDPKNGWYQISPALSSPNSNIMVRGIKESINN